MNTPNKLRLIKVGAGIVSALIALVRPHCAEPRGVRGNKVHQEVVGCRSVYVLYSLYLLMTCLSLHLCHEEISKLERIVSLRESLPFESICVINSLGVALRRNGIEQTQHL